MDPDVKKKRIGRKEKKLYRTIHTISRNIERDLETLFTALTRYQDNGCSAEELRNIYMRLEYWVCEFRAKLRDFDQSMHITKRKRST